MLIKGKEWRVFLSFLVYTVLLLLLGCSSEGESPLATPTETSRAPSKPQASREALLPSFAAIVAKAKPAVVNIATTQTIETPEGHPFFGPDSFGEETPFEEFFRHFFPDMPKTFKRQSLGSGFVIDPEGLIITNHHVVDRAEKIIIRLEKKEFEAQILGSDPATDLAILKIKPERKLPTLSFGDSSQLQVGDWVIAIGNPFGLSQTVTAGIVSATSRVIGQGPYDDFIQTDASINPGNSGGPLLNLEGKVVGINTAIFSQTGANIGIGFAIPSNLSRDITGKLRTQGKVVRGWLGVVVQDLDKDLATAFDLPEVQGALVVDVKGEGPADKAGLKRGDVILSFGGKSVQSLQDLSREVAATEPGIKVPVEIIRQGKKQALTVEVGEQ